MAELEAESKRGDQFSVSQAEQSAKKTADTAWENQTDIKVCSDFKLVHNLKFSMFISWSTLLTYDGTCRVA